MPLLDKLITDCIPDGYTDDAWQNEAGRLISVIDTEHDQIECVKMARRFWNGYTMDSKVRLVKDHHERMKNRAYRDAFWWLVLV